MTCRIRAGRPSDLGALYDLAKLTGGGFTNLPAEKATLEAKLARSEEGFSREGETMGHSRAVSRDHARGRAIPSHPEAR